jgi:UDP-N-acetylglucosamine 2-epimerase (non-hydrolysing)
MRVMTVLGTRPEIIRLSAVIPLLDAHADHLLVHTGQNYDDRLSRIFFEELGVRQPDVSLGVRGPGFAAQVGQILERTEALFLEHRPDRLLILGDTNSGLVALAARRLGIPVYHMEAGNRCYDDRVPEEVNRRVIDHSSTVLLPYTERSRQNLLAEGIPGSRIYVTGNPIKQVIDRFALRIEASRALAECGVDPARYFLVTAHRSENVDNPARLRSLLDGLEALSREYGFPVLYPLHPRTRSRAESAGIALARNGVWFLSPRGFFDFIRLEQSAFCILSDSGTVQEEACLFGVPNVTLRDVTERPETVECGSNILCGVEPPAIRNAVRVATRQVCPWQPPREYLESSVAETVCRIVLGFRLPDAAEAAWRDSAFQVRTPCAS